MAQEVIKRVVDGHLAPPRALRQLATGAAPGLPALTTSATAELDALVGLRPVKALVKELVAYVRIQQLRRAAGLVTEASSLHMVFTGNPGTGKTTVARIMGKLFKELGVLSRGHFTEVTRADIVGEYIGHTAQRCRELIRKALGGVLFIDEAYALARGGPKDFGKEAIDCLVAEMENHRADLLIIFAGYPAEMEWFLSQNPGLRSRLPIHLHFPDYAPSELVEIAQKMWAAREYRLSADASLYLRGLVDRPGFGAVLGNARAIRNLVERSLRRQALRLYEVPSPSRDELMRITRADLEGVSNPG